MLVCCFAFLLEGYSEGTEEDNQSFRVLGIPITEASAVSLSP